MNYAIYDASSGRITRVLGCPEEYVAGSCNDSEAWLSCTTENDSTHYVKDGRLVPFPSQPSPYHTWNWASMEWIPNLDAAWLGVRRSRDALIARTDWTQLPDVPAATRSKWAEYRQALRDIPQTQIDPLHVVWPVAPDS